jgi:hypothetical protein
MVHFVYVGWLRRPHLQPLSRGEKGALDAAKLALGYGIIRQTQM